MEQILSERPEKTFAANDFSHFLDILHKMAVKEFDTWSIWFDIYMRFQNLAKACINSQLLGTKWKYFALMLKWDTCPFI